MLARHLGQASAPAAPVAAEEAATSEPAGLLGDGLLDPDKVAALIDVFRGELLAHAELIDKAFRRRNRTLLLEATHQLKGTAGFYGFSGISETARIFCERLRAGDKLEGLQSAVRELAALCRQAAAGPPS